MRLLIAEDDVFLAMELEETVLKAGHEVVCNTGSAKEALDYAKEMGAALALVDIGLSDGQEAGVWLARSLRELGIPSIFVSGQSAEARNAKDAALGYLPKPYTSGELAAALEFASVVIGGRQPEQAAVPPRLELFGAAAFWPAGEA